MPERSGAPPGADRPDAGGAEIAANAAAINRFRLSFILAPPALRQPMLHPFRARPKARAGYVRLVGLDARTPPRSDMNRPAPRLPAPRRRRGSRPSASAPPFSRTRRRE